MPQFPRAVPIILALGLLIGFRFAVAGPPELEPPEPAVEPSVPESVTSQRPATEAIPLLDNDLIQLKVKLTEEQKRKIEELLEMARQDIAEVQERLPSEEQRDAIANALRLKATEVVERYREQVDSILTPQQQAQLRALGWRWRGMTVLSDPDVARELGLTGEQQEQVSFLIEEAEENKRSLRRETRRTGRQGRVDRRQQLRAIDEQLNADLKAVLTPEQRQQLEDLQAGSLTPPPPPADLGQDVELGKPSELGQPAELGEPLEP